MRPILLLYHLYVYNNKMQCTNTQNTFEAINCDCTCDRLGVFMHLFPYFPFVYEIKIKPKGERLNVQSARQPMNSETKKEILYATKERDSFLKRHSTFWPHLVVVE